MSITNDDLPDMPEGTDPYDDNDGLDNNCPNCGCEYDEIDREFQICHLCDYDNNITY